MAKRVGFHPSIILRGSSEGDFVVIGGGSGEGGSHPVPCSYHDWLNSVWAEDDFDFDGDGSFSVAEYCAWWSDQMGTNSPFTMELWYELNQGLTWDSEWIE